MPGAFLTIFPANRFPRNRYTAQHSSCVYCGDRSIVMAMARYAHENPGCRAVFPHIGSVKSLFRRIPSFPHKAGLFPHTEFHMAQKPRVYKGFQFACHAYFSSDVYGKLRKNSRTYRVLSALRGFYTHSPLIFHTFAGVRPYYFPHPEPLALDIASTAQSAAFLMLARVSSPYGQTPTYPLLVIAEAGLGRILRKRSLFAAFECTFSTSS